MIDLRRDPDYPKPPGWHRVYDRHFPRDTDPWSRHVKTIAEGMRAIRSPLRKLLIEADYEPDHMASSMERTVMQLWEARQEIARLKAKYESDERSSN